MTEIENKQAAKPQSDWDGDIIPHIQTTSHSNKLFATLWPADRKQ
jgi:hypothetical protein